MEYTSSSPIAETMLQKEKPFWNIHWNIYQIFVVLSLFYIILGLISYLFIFTDDIYHRQLAQQMTATQIEEFLEMQSQYWWLQLLMPFVIVAVKATYTALCLTIGIIIIGQNVSFKEVFRIALIAELVFILAMVVQVLGTLWFIEVRVPDDYANFAPFSLLQFFDPATLKLWMKHPLKTFSLFEALYVVVISWLLLPLQKEGTRFWATFRLVGVSYGCGLLFWMVALAFLLLQVS